MIVPPSLLRIELPGKGRERRGFQLWLPLFLMWPLFFILALLALSVAVSVDAVLVVARARFHGYTRLTIACMRTLCAIRGTRVHVRSSDGNVDFCLI